MARKPKAPKSIEALTHDDATRKNIPTAEYQSVMKKDDQAPVKVNYPRGSEGLEAEKESRNRDLDPQLVWRGKDQQDWSDLVVNAPPLYIQEKVHPKVLIDDLRRRTEAAEKEAEAEQSGAMADLFADFNGLPDEGAKTEFYQHDAHWTNRMILGDSLQVMASLAEREGLRGKVQCIYFDPPYGIKFNSNFQWSTTSRDVKDGKAEHITREPEMVKAFRDTWRDGINSYLSYLRDRLTVARELLAASGSIFVQISDENVHRVRAIMDEVFGEENFVNTIVFKKKSATYSTETVFDYLIWYCRDRGLVKVRDLFEARVLPENESKFNTIITPGAEFHSVVKLDDAKVDELVSSGGRWARVNYPIVSQHPSETRSGNYNFRGKLKKCGSNKQWRFDPILGMKRIERAQRLYDGGGASLGGVVFWDDWNQVARSNIWGDVHGEKYPTYVVQTATTVVQRCILMTSDPGDLILDPTCGSGTTAAVSEQWGRRWITIDTSRVSLALARARIMGARYPYYLLVDSNEGQAKEAEITRTAPSSQPTHGHIGHGFVYERVPHITLKSIANNTEIDVIWDKFQETLEPLREQLNRTLSQKWEEWAIPREANEDWPESAKKLHDDWWRARITRQQEIDASIAAKADHEFLYDKPYEDKKKVRVAGPFTVESLSPHRVLGVDENDELIDPNAVDESDGGYSDGRDFVQMILENLKTSGVQQAHKDDKIDFTSLSPWPGELVCAEGRYFDGGEEGGAEKRAAIFIGPEFGTVSRPDLVQAAREAADADFDVLIACAFNYEAHTTEFEKLGRIPVLKARMNADLHMADDLKNTGKGNLFVIFGEPDIDILDAENNQIQVKVNGVDIFKPQTGEVISDSADGIACWFIDTDYNEESFFVRQAYFLGANDPYKSLKTTLKAEINAEAWETLNSDTSRPFKKPHSGRIAVKVINHLGDEVMKVFRV
ncbi:site-specific DNA-methyltransferase [Alcanivorax sp.]|uniref:site-specific DNA-methyltransferase n=1 Tax=Alcanivorax sp. TaxID=1872427 RepID=UPI00243C52A2|nr:site-specific DNA-methyltransferase [Alcanivorax sp.]